MSNHVHSVSLTYGDTELSFYNIKLRKCHIDFSQLHCHSYYELHIQNTQPITYRFPDRTITANPGELLIIPPQTPHYSNENYRETTVLSLSLASIPGNEKSYDIITQTLQQHALHPIPFLYPEDIVLLNQDEPYQSFLGICKLKAIAADFTYRLFAQLAHNTSFSVRGKQDALILIDNMITRPDVTLSEMASAINYSKRHTARLIKKHYGASLSALRKENKHG